VLRGHLLAVDPQADRKQRPGHGRDDAVAGARIVIAVAARTAGDTGDDVRAVGTTGVVTALVDSDVAPGTVTDQPATSASPRSTAARLATGASLVRGTSVGESRQVV